MYILDLLIVLSMIINKYFNSLNWIKYSLIIYFISFGYSQSRIGEWDALTSPLNVRDLTTVDDQLYVATEGGILEIKDSIYQTFTTIDGLVGVDLSAIDQDNNGHLWIGGSSPYGFVQVYDPERRQSVIHFDYGLTGIIDIQVLDSLAFVFFNDGQDVGIMKFYFDEGWEYRDSYRNFPVETGEIHCFTSNDSMLFIGTDNGIYSGLIQENLKDPNRWGPVDNNMIMSVTIMTMNNSNLIFSSETSLYELSIESAVWSEIDFNFQFSKISEIFVHENSIWIVDNKYLYRKTIEQDLLVDDQYKISAIILFQGQIVAGLQSGLLFISEEDNGSHSVNRFIPNAPVTSGFSAITILEDGRLVGGSKYGISIYSNDGWRNIIEIITTGSETINNDYDYSMFIADTVMYDFGGYIADIEQGSDGLVYCAVRGSYPVTYNEPIRKSGGVIVMDIDNPSNITLIDTTELSYHTTSSNSRPYMVVLDIEFDQDGNLWVANPYCINGNQPIHVRSTDNDWKHYGSSETGVKISQTPGSITFDSWGRMWYSAFQANEANLGIYPNGGIFLLDFNGDPYNPDSFSWNKVQESGTVWSLGMGFNNRLYYLTPTGLNYFDLTNSSASPVTRENNYAYFPNISYGAGAEIKIDPHGNIWTHSPTDGIHILLENTTYWPDINGLRTDNSPLLSDAVTDIAFDEKRNLAYIATSKGVNILRIPFGKEKKNYNEIKVFPSPFYIPAQKSMIVDGLPFESSMMVTTLDGKIVRHIPSQGTSMDGDQLVWDGRDEAGDYVSSGVYLLAIYGMNGSQTVEKITVIKK